MFTKQDEKRIRRPDPVSERGTISWLSTYPDAAYVWLFSQIQQKKWEQIVNL